MAESKRICSVNGCIKNLFAKGLCSMHYSRLRVHGDLSATRTHKKAIKKILEDALNASDEECLIWTFNRNHKGYGILWVDGRQVKVHRHICEIVHGPPSDTTMHAAHYCGVASCINPAHLRWATPAENNRDKIAHGTHLRGEDCPWSKLSEADVKRIKSHSGGLSLKEMADDLGVSPMTIQDIKSGRRWKHI